MPTPTTVERIFLVVPSSRGWLGTQRQSRSDTATACLEAKSAEALLREGSQSQSASGVTTANIAPKMGIKDVFSFGTGLWDPSHRFETSWLLSPWLLFVFRAAFGIYAFVVLFFIIGWTCTHASLGGCPDVEDSFSYFTVLCYWGLAFYFTVSAFHTFTYALRGRPLLDVFPRPLQALHALFYTTLVVYPFLVTIVYWGILYENPWFVKTFNAWSNISEHAMNSAFAIFEILVPRTDPPLFIHILWLIVMLVGYLAVAYITYAAQGWYTYDFLDYEEVGGRGIVAAYIIGIAVGTVVVFLVVWCLIWARRWLTEKVWGMEGKFGRQPVRNDDLEMSAIQPKDRHQAALV